jgi:probable phosphoglycerate mutase
MPDSATRVIAIRHGETAWNAATRIQGQLDVGLNEVGRRQVLRLAGALADAGLTALYSSDLLRARQTAQAVAERTGLALVPDAGLRERCFGVFEGHTYADVEQRWPLEARRLRQRDRSYGPAGGETLDDFYGRCLASATRLAARHPGETIALVAHGGVLDCLYRAATRIDLQAPRTWHLGNASINRLLYSDAGFTLVGWSDLLHLEGNALDEDDSGGVDATADGRAA